MFFHAEILPPAELFWQILVKTEGEEITLFCSCQNLTLYFTLITFQFSHFEAGVWQVGCWRWEGCWQLEHVFCHPCENLFNMNYKLVKWHKIYRRWFKILAVRVSEKCIYCAGAHGWDFRDRKLQFLLLLIVEPSALIVRWASSLLTASRKGTHKKKAFLCSDREEVKRGSSSYGEQVVLGASKRQTVQGIGTGKGFSNASRSFGVL